MRLVIQVTTQTLTEEQAATFDAAKTPAERAVVLAAAKSAAAATPDSEAATPEGDGQ